MLVEDGPVVVDGVETVSGITMAGGAVVTGAAEVVCSHVGSTVDVVVVVEPVVLGTAHGLNRPGSVGGSRTCEGWRAWQHHGSTALS